MSTLNNLRTSGNRLKSVLCLTLALSPVLLIATAPGPASAQNGYPGSNIVCSRQFAYVANEDGNNVSGYIIDRANGKLTPVEGSPFYTGKSGPTSVAVDPAGRFLYVTNQNARDNDVAGFSIDCDTGRLTPVPGSPFAAGSGPSSIAIDPSGRYAYVSNSGSNNVSAFKIDQNSGRFVPVSGSPFRAGSSPSSVAVDSSGQFVYVTNKSSDNVSGYTINSATGALTAISGSPFAAGTSPVSAAVDPNNRFVYVANQGSDNISGYSINLPTGGLGALATSPYGPVAGGFTSVTFDPTGGFVYLTGSGGVSAYNIQTNPTDIEIITPPAFPPVISLYGQLTPVTGSPFGGGTPGFAAVDYSGTFLYAANKSSNDVSAYTLSLGVLKPIAASPFSTGSGPVSIALVRPRTTPLYSATEIPIPEGLGGLQSIIGAAINNKGEVTGTLTTVAGGPLEAGQSNPGSERFGSAFIYAGGTTTLVAFSRFSSGNDINDSGQVVGQTNITPPFTGEPPSQAFLYSYSNNSTVVIDNVAFRPSDAYGINNAGHVTGSLSTVPCTGVGPFQMCNLGDTHAFYYAGAGLMDIGTLGGTFSTGTSINNLNQIVGISSVATSSLNHLFFYAQGHMYDLGTPAGQSVVGAAINDHDEIIGSAVNSTGVAASFIRRANGFEKLSFIAGALNNSGDIVGAKVVANGSSHAFILYGDRKPIDLNDLVDPSLTLLTSAAGISDNGKIVASGLNGHLYVLTPK
jgi:probable HAF family extracellular repeat protein